MVADNTIIHSFIYCLLHPKVSKDLLVGTPKSLYQRAVYRTAPVGLAKKCSVLLSIWKIPC